MGGGTLRPSQDAASSVSNTAYPQHTHRMVPVSDGGQQRLVLLQQLQLLGIHAPQLLLGGLLRRGTLLRLAGSSALKPCQLLCQRRQHLRIIRVHRCLQADCQRLLLQQRLCRAAQLALELRELLQQDVLPAGVQGQQEEEGESARCLMCCPGCN